MYRLELEACGITRLDPYLGLDPSLAGPPFDRRFQMYSCGGTLDGRAKKTHLQSNLFGWYQGDLFSSQGPQHDAVGSAPQQPSRPQFRPHRPSAFGNPL